MHKKTIIINTGPLLSLIAGLGKLEILIHLYKNVIVPNEVVKEIEIGGKKGFGIDEFKKAKWLNKINEPIVISEYLKNSLDIGEASVIQFALNNNIKTVCIDEAVGRRVARLNGLNVTGTIGILIRARKEGYIDSIKNVLDNMQQKGIWLSKELINFACKFSGE